MKKVLSLLLVAVFVLSLMVCGASASVSARTVSAAPTDSEPVLPLFGVGGCYALPNSEFTVPLWIENNPGLVAFKVSLTYDTARLSLIGVRWGDFDDAVLSSLDSPFWASWNAEDNVDNTTDGVIAYLTFHVKPDAALGQANLQLTYDLEDVYNTDGIHKGFVTQSAYVNVVEYLAGDANGDKKINNRDVGLLQQYLNDWQVTVSMSGADVNGDGAVNNRDVGLLQQYLNGWDVTLAHPEPPVPPVPPDSPADTLLDQVPDELNTQKIKMQIWWNATEADQARVDAFRDRTGIQVKFETSTLDKYLSSLTGKVLAGNAPHTAAILSEWYPLPITRGLMQPITETGWNYDNVTDDVYALPLMDQFAYKGVHYGIALKGSIMPKYAVMFYNKDLLAANGIVEDPYQLWEKGQWNWETCMKIAEACTDAKQDRYGLTLSSHAYWMLSAGQDFVLSDAGGLKSNVTGSKMVHAWTHAWDMVHTYKTVASDFSSAAHRFYDEQAAMFAASSQLMQATFDEGVAANATFAWGVVPFPSPKGQNPVSACEGVVWGFPTRTKGNGLQAAMWWLRYYLDDNTYASRDQYPTEDCWAVLNWMSMQQKVQSYNSVGVLCYGGQYSAWSIPCSVIDEATNRAMILTELSKWSTELDMHIAAMENEY